MNEFDLIHKKALRLGFDRCGIASSRPLEDLRPKLERWLSLGHHGDLTYMQRNLDKRLDPKKLVANACSVIVCALNYAQPQAPNRSTLGRIASYAWGRDYHAVLKEKLHALFTYMQQLRPSTQGRVFVDTAPLLEKAWAVEAGLGWIGRHSLLIVPEIGSFVVLGCIVSDFEIRDTAAQQTPLPDHCGNCRLCIEGCPTGALQTDRTVDASRCIARRTIEKGDYETDLHGWIFGCDRCQQLCPHNRHAPLTHTPEFSPLSGIQNMEDEAWLRLTPEEFLQRFGETPLNRCGLQRIQDRIKAAPTDTLTSK